MIRPRLALVAGALAVALVLAFIVVRSWGGTSYTAEFTHASGLKKGDEVRVAGIPTGRVTSIELDGAVAVVRFTLDDVTLRADATAAVKLATMLGRNYLEVRPGSGPALRGDTIGVDRTTAAYTISQVVTDGQATLTALDVDTLEQAIDTIATELDNDPDANAAALTGATRLARAIGSRGEQIDRLLVHVRDVTALVREQQDTLDALLVDADTVTAMLVRRRTTIENLLTTASSVVQRLERLAATTDADVRALLTQFRDVLGAIQADAEAVDATLERLAPMSRYFANATGNGPWIDVYAPFFLFPDNLLCPLLSPGACR